jgi:hypothetical protein
VEGINFKIGTKKNPLIIALKEFKGRKLFDIRKFFVEKNGEKLIPTKKGISLNRFQLEQVIDTLKYESINISNFFEIEELTEKILQIETVKSTFGRGFNVEFKNGDSKLLISEELKNKLGENNLDFFKKILDCLYQSADEIIEDEDDIQLFLDIFNNKINKVKW